MASVDVELDDDFLTLVDCDFLTLVDRDFLTELELELEVLLLDRLEVEME